MSPMSPRLLRPRIKGDPDALRYIAAVQSADGQSLEAGVKTAIEAFVVGCKADGVWSSIKASCILMGARTLSGALVPLAGTAPTNVNFVVADYDRKTGLVGDGSTKRLSTNYANNSDPAEDAHGMAWLSTAGSGSLFSGGYLASTTRQMFWTNGQGNADGSNWEIIVACNSTSRLQGFRVRRFGAWAVTRSGSSGYTMRYGGSDEFVTSAPSSVGSEVIQIFAGLQSGVTYQFASHRIAFYSLGRSASLASLASRVSALYTAIGAAI